MLSSCGQCAPRGSLPGACHGLPLGVSLTHTRDCTGTLANGIDQSGGPAKHGPKDCYVPQQTIERAVSETAGPQQRMRPPQISSFDIVYDICQLQPQRTAACCPPARQACRLCQSAACQVVRGTALAALPGETMSEPQHGATSSLLCARLGNLLASLQ